MTTALCRAVFLDRDGVLNRAIVRDGKPYPPQTLAELEIEAEAAQALALLRNAGFLLIGATNQPDVARGTQRREIVEAINQALLETLPLREIVVCYHDDVAHCGCRKPRPGLLYDAARRYAIDLASSFMIGDRWRDVDAGHEAGCRAILIDCGYVEAEPQRPPDYTARSLSDAVAWILMEPCVSNPQYGRNQSTTEAQRTPSKSTGDR